MRALITAAAGVVSEYGGAALILGVIVAAAGFGVGAGTEFAKHWLEEADSPVQYMTSGECPAGEEKVFTWEGMTDGSNEFYCAPEGSASVHIDWDDER